MSKMKELLKKNIPKILYFTQFLPLFVFLNNINKTMPAGSADFSQAFFYSGFLSVGILILLLMIRIPSHPLFYGINLYLYTGAIGFTFEHEVITTLYDELRSTGMMWWVLLMGLIQYFFDHQRGFIGIKSKNTKQLNLSSRILLISTAIAVIWCIIFKNNRFLSEVFPFVTLFIIMIALQYKLKND